MVWSRTRLVLCTASLAAISLLALPGAAVGFQTVKIEGGTLFITGDVGKTPDEVTIDFDSVKNEYVIGHDIDMLLPPPGCTFEGGGPPYKILHCPAPGIKRIRIDLGSDKDRVTFSNIIEKVFNPLAPYSYVPVDLVSYELNTGTGNDKFDGGGQPFSGPALATTSAGNSAVQAIDMGTGVDVVTLVAGINNVTFGGSGKLTVSDGVNQIAFGEGNSSLNLGGGTNTIVVGTGNSKATVSGGANNVTFGAGNSTYTASGGTNVVIFGPGNSVFTGGSGNDSAFFGPGPGNNSFTGGEGSDSVSLGPGKDTATGGPGRDLLRGGPSKDTLRGGAGADSLFGGPGKDGLFGGAAFDRLFGGSGNDSCFGGGPGLLIGCELPAGPPGP